jgi:hypothetical protein
MSGWPPRWEGGVWPGRDFPWLGILPGSRAPAGDPGVPEKKDVPMVAHPRNILMGCKCQGGSWGSQGKQDSHAGSPHQNEKHPRSSQADIHQGTTGT